MMRRFAVCLLAAVGFAAPPEAPRPELTQVKNVYLLSMGQGLDQYLANHMNRHGLFQVVADPALADAVFTEQLGRDFEYRFKELYPPPEQVEKEKEKEKSDEGKDARKDDGSDAEKALREQTMMRSSTFSRGRGNVFLVDIKSRRVIWSHHLRPRNSSPRELNQTAADIVERLGRDLQGK